MLKGVQVQRVQNLTVAQTFEAKPSIEITTNVDARISLDGQEVGRTQDKRLVLDDLDVGTFKVTLARQDYLEQTRQVSITRKDEVGNVSFELAEIPVVAPPVVDYGGGGATTGGVGVATTAARVVAAGTAGTPTSSKDEGPAGGPAPRPPAGAAPPRLKRGARRRPSGEPYQTPAGGGMFVRRPDKPPSRGLGNPRPGEG